MQLELEPDLDKMAQPIRALFKFKDFYNQMDFNPKQRLAITKIRHRANGPIS